MTIDGFSQDMINNGVDFPHKLAIAMPCHAAMSGQLPPNNKCCMTLVPCHFRASLMFRDTLRDTGYFKLCHNAIDCYIISILVGYYGKSHEFSMKPRVSTPQDPRLNYGSVLYISPSRGPVWRSPETLWAPGDARLWKPPIWDYMNGLAW